MLTQLYIQNIAVIEQASIDFEPGFTVLTGETGAGKSIIIDAIYAVLGERTSKELVRTGAEQASVSALFTDVSPQTQQVLRELDIPLEDDGSLLIRREIRPHGRSSCKLNNIPATVSMLRAVGGTLIDILGQHESYKLLSPEVHGTYTAQRIRRCAASKASSMRSNPTRGRSPAAWIFCAIRSKN